MTSDQLRTLENYVSMGNTLTTEQALDLIKAVKVAQAAPEAVNDPISPLRKRIVEWMEDLQAEGVGEGVLVLGGPNGDSTDVAFMGITTVWNRDGKFDVSVYDYEKCIEALMSEGMDLDEAVEYFEFNVEGAYVGPHTPVFLKAFPR
jgi:hypothetical protein